MRDHALTILIAEDDAKVRELSGEHLSQSVYQRLDVPHEVQ